MNCPFKLFSIAWGQILRLLLHLEAKTVCLCQFHQLFGPVFEKWCDQNGKLPADRSGKMGEMVASLRIF